MSSTAFAGNGNRPPFFGGLFSFFGGPFFYWMPIFFINFNLWIVENLSGRPG